jgi:hypothetical protein
MVGDRRLSSAGSEAFAAPVGGHELGAPSPPVGGPVHLRRPRPLGLIKTPAATQMVGNMVPVPKVAPLDRTEWAPAGGGPPNISAATTTGPTLSDRT